MGIDQVLFAIGLLLYGYDLFTPDCEKDDVKIESVEVYPAGKYDFIRTENGYEKRLNPSYKTASN